MFFSAVAFLLVVRVTSDSISSSFLKSQVLDSIPHIQNDSLLWGTYRPNLYFGTRTKTPNTLLTGLMWYHVDQINGWKVDFRHTFEQNDGMLSAGAVLHDGRTVSKQEFKDIKNSYKITTQFLKHPGGDNGGSWSLRVSGKPIVSGYTPSITIMYYANVEGKGELKQTSPEGTYPVTFSGSSPELGKYKLKLYEDPGNQYPNPQYGNFDYSIPRVLKKSLHPEKAWRIKDIVQEFQYRNAVKLLEKDPNLYKEVAGFLLFPEEENKPANTYVIQQTFSGSFEFEVVFLSQSAVETSGHTEDQFRGKKLTEKLLKSYKHFHEKFEDKYGLSKKGFSEKEIKTAKAALSNLLGGMGYFYGDSILSAKPKEYNEDDSEEEEDQSDQMNSKPKSKGSQSFKSDPIGLFTAVPSRPFFPRGFLWDEGFHQLLIGTWDNDLSVESIRSWLSLMNAKGWIGREQILGEEARSKVPVEFQTQYPDIANPPTLALAIMAFANRFHEYHRDKMPDIILQKGLVFTEELEHFEDDTLTNGYLTRPMEGIQFLETCYEHLQKWLQWFRTTQYGEPDGWGRMSANDEVYRWRGRNGIHTMASGLDDYPRGKAHEAELHLDLLCWVGLLSKNLAGLSNLLHKGESEKYHKILSKVMDNLEKIHWDEEEKVYADIGLNEDMDSSRVIHKGYVSLFPLLLGLLPVNSPKVEALLNLMRDPEHLWTPFGLRSLSTKDPFYRSEEDYWRGAIWININYMALSVLHNKYSSIPGPYQTQAREIYKELRENIIKNLLKVYENSGYLWEQYSDTTGQGKRSRPFTGWTSLLVLIMSEIYP